MAITSAVKAGNGNAQAIISSKDTRGLVVPAKKTVAPKAPCRMKFLRSVECIWGLSLSIYFLVVKVNSQPVFLGMNWRSLGIWVALTNSRAFAGLPTTAGSIPYQIISGSTDLPRKLLLASCVASCHFFSLGKLRKAEASVELDEPRAFVGGKTIAFIDWLE